MNKRLPHKHRFDEFSPTVFLLFCSKVEPMKSKNNTSLEEFIYSFVELSKAAFD